jgi:hypothetical protein
MRFLHGRRSMTLLIRAALALAFLLLLAPARADTLRCNGAIAAEGDTKLSVYYKCGQPVLADASCAPVYYLGMPYPFPWGTFVPCQSVEEWLYDRGPGNLMATVRFRNGKVESIRYDRLPQ